MMGGAEVRRGKKAEDRIAKAFQAARGKPFARYPGSGSGHTWKFFGGKKVRGDVGCLDEAEGFPFCIESKKVPRGWPWDWVLVGQPLTEWTEWWEKIEQDARADCKFPMLVVSRNQGPMVAFLYIDNARAAGMNVDFARVRFSLDGRPNHTVLVATVEDVAAEYARSTERKS